jgi:hypothetical protein
MIELKEPYRTCVLADATAPPFVGDPRKKHYRRAIVGPNACASGIADIALPRKFGLLGYGCGAENPLRVVAM